MDKQMKLALAMAAVSAYIQAEEEQLAQSQSNQTRAWSQAGRLVQIQQRRMVQDRAAINVSTFR